MTVKVLLFFLLAIILALFTYQNQMAIDIRLLNWEIKEVPVFIILLFGLIFGFLLAFVMQLPTILRLRNELKKVVRELEHSETIETADEEEQSSEGSSMGNDYKGGFFNS
jgi:uncharacterized integral membrane protein